MNPRLGIDVVPFEDGDSVKVIGKYARGHQPRQAATNNYCVLTEAICHKAPSRFCRFTSAQVLQEVACARAAWETT